MRSKLLHRTGWCVPLLAIFIGAPAAHASGCGDPAPEIGAPSVRTTTVCLLNVERQARGLAPLRADRRLARAAGSHSRDMVAHRYFAHDSRSGVPFSARIAATGWMQGRDTWSVGENLAWGGGRAAGPGAIVAAWMASSVHRANILAPRFRTIGVGVAASLPIAAGGTGATYTTDFGS